jgi:sucrose-phosphate synthase
MKQDSMRYKKLLAMDLDGTFVPGDFQDRIIRTCKKHKIRFGFITGRNLQSCYQPVNFFDEYKPDFLSCSVGNQLFIKKSEKEYMPDNEYMQALLQNWPGHSVIIELLKDLADCELQKDADGVRVSYFVGKDETVERIKERLKPYHLRIVYSKNIYLDIMPINGSKGGCLQHIARIFEVEMNSIITTGDMINDLDMLVPPFRGIVVQNAERKLLDLLSDKENIFFSEYPGSEGIYNGLCHILSANTLGKEEVHEKI